MKRVVFLLGVVDRMAARTGDPLSETDYDIINSVAERLGVEADICFAVPDERWGGRAKDVKMGTMREHRVATLTQVMECKPDVVVACGPLALKCVMNKGNVPLRDHLRESLDIPEFDSTICVASHSMEQINAKPGMDKWLVLDVNAALHGRTKTKWGKYKVLLPSDPAWAKLPKELANAKQLGCDLETFPGLSEWDPDARIRMMVLSDRAHRAWIIQAKMNSQLPRWATRICADPKIQKCGSNIKFDFKWMERHGYTIQNMFDTSTAEHVLDCTNPLTDLKSLTFIYAPWLGDYSREHRELVKARGGWEFVGDAEQYTYCGGDGEASIVAAKEQTKRLKKEKLVRPFTLSMGLYRVLAGMEARGACVSMRTNRELDREFDAGLRELRQQLTEVLGPINPNSPAQLTDALFKAVPNIDLNKPRFLRQMSGVYYKMKSDKPDDDFSTDKEVLEREASKHPIIETVLQYRRYARLHGTYVVGLRNKHIVHHTGRRTYVHTSYRTDVVETYRLSSQGPNMQNIPRKPEPDDPHPIPLNLNIKRQYVSRYPRGVVTEADLSQAEIRIAAELSQDRAMTDAILSGDDLHTALTATFRGVAPEQVTKLQRTQGKRQTFLVMYGGGANTLARQIGCSKPEAKRLLAQYFAAFYDLDRYIKQVKLDVKRDLFSESLFGYRRKFREPAQWNTWEGWRVERQAWNHQVQNAAACCCFVAMIDVQRALDKHKMKSVLIAQVHDSILVDTHPSEKKQVARILVECLQQPSLHEHGVKLSIPLVADVGQGKNWGQLKDIPVDSL